MLNFSYECHKVLVSTMYYLFSWHKCCTFVLFLTTITMKSLILIFLISVPIQFAFASPQSLVDSSKKDLASLQKKETLLWVSLGGGVLGPYIGGDFKTTYAWGERSIEMKVIGASEL